MIADARSAVLGLTRDERHGKRHSLPPHWYFFTIRYCPICGHDDTTRERRFDPRPDDLSARRDVKEVWDYCDAF